MLAERTDSSATPQAKHPGGRPSDYKPEVAKAFCDAYATTPLTLIALVQGSPDFPDVRTLYRWARAHDEFRQAWDLAREERADMLFDECVELADKERRQRKVKTWKGEREVTTEDAVERSKLQITVRQRVAKALSPGRYGDKVEHTGTVTLEALILASMKLPDAPNPVPAIEGQAVARPAVSGPEDEDKRL